MLRNLFLALVTFSVLSFVLFENSIAKNNESDENLPEKNGIYNVSGRSELKLRVFVHPTKVSHPGKPMPTATPAPSINCSLTDPDSLAEDGITGWHLSRTNRYYINSASVPASVGRQNLATIAYASFNEYLSELTDVQVVNVGETTLSRARLDGMNIIAWDKAQSGTLGITYTWYNNATGTVVEVDTIMNKNYPWKWSGNPTCAYPGSYDAQNILTHELGHWFGLNDSYEIAFENNTMYGYGDVEEAKKDTLATGDVNAVKKIYPLGYFFGETSSR